MNLAKLPRKDVHLDMNIRFFVVGSGRSGSTWLARALDLDESVRVWHEPLHEFDRKHALRLRGGTSAGEFLAQRVKLMERVAAGHPGQDYAEVNSYLRRCVLALRETFGVPVAGLVRDGRYTVRSTLIRMQQRKAEGLVARCCRDWAETYWVLLLQGVPIFKLEQLNEDYGYFRHLCDTVGAEVAEEDWRTVAGVPVHQSIAHQVKQFRWTDEHVRIFRELAGDVQEAFGYPLEGI